MEDCHWKLGAGVRSSQVHPDPRATSAGTLTCVFQQAGYACGRRPYRRLQDIDNLPSSETTDPYERLRVALQTGRLRAKIVGESPDEGGFTESTWGMDDWLAFDSLADPAIDAPDHFLSDVARYAALVSREEAIRVEAELSAAEAERLVWKLEQTLGWIGIEGIGLFALLGAST